jgi:hypothetical protein
MAVKVYVIDAWSVAVEGSLFTARHVNGLEGG